MTEPYYQDDAVTLWHGDALDVLRSMPDRDVDCIVTSPPYFGLRDYGSEGQYGLEASPAEYVETMRALFSEARRVLSDDGTLWLNLGDSYNNTSSGQNGTGSTGITGGRHDRIGGRRTSLPSQLPAKNLLGIPWRVAFALQDDGWILRNSIIWAKPNAMPESVTDRLSTKHENVFMFSKSKRYWFDLDAVREPLTGEFLSSGARNPRWGRPGGLLPGEIRGEVRGRPSESGKGLAPNSFSTPMNESGRNPGDVWTIPTQPYPGAHFAVFPLAIPERCIQAGCKPGGTVLDPFSGSGTTGLAAAKHGRRYVGVDLNSEYLDLSLRTRLAQPALDFGALT